MNLPTFATLFSGGGVADMGIQAAGYRHAWSIELDDAIAGTARANGFGVITANVLDVDPHALEAPDYLHASPVCTRASQANQTAEVNEHGTKEAQLDRNMAVKVCRFVDVLKPRAFSLENVYQYREFESFQMILAALTRNRYLWDYANLNAADFGVPQTRRRLILRAVRGGLLRPLPAPVEWVGWYAAIEDLIPTLPESKFAPWQLARLPEFAKESLLVGGSNTNFSDATIGRGANSAHEPALTVTARQKPRAFIVDGTRNDNGTKVTVKSEDEPLFTVAASMDKRPTRAWLSAGRVVKMTPRALARFQSIPDSYQLPAKDALAVKIIGNGYPSLLAQRIAENLAP